MACFFIPAGQRYKFATRYTLAVALTYGTVGWIWPKPAVNLADRTADWILIAWLTLMLTGQWRPKGEWFDRAGIVLGAYSVVAFLLAPLVIEYSRIFS